MAGLWKVAGGEIQLDRCLVMGILNVTPDSFSDGGRFIDVGAAVDHGVRMASEGADIIDIGGESTRPGASPVSADEEAERVVPVIEKLYARVDLPISIDSMKAEVAEAAIAAGASIINDVSALRNDIQMAEVAAATGAGVVLMHMQGEPRDMQAAPRYDDVVGEVKASLAGWAKSAVGCGIDARSVVIDPGIGFGKTVEHNLSLLASLQELKTGYPLLVGPSRKSFIGKVLGLEVDERLEGTAAVVSWCVANGADVVRVHDVEQMVRVVRMTEAIARSAGG